MKKTYLSQRNAFLTPSDLSWGAAALAFVIVLVLLRLLVPGFFMRLVAPVLSAGSWPTTLVGGLAAGFEKNAALQHANDVLLEQNAALEVENRALAEKAADLERVMGTSPSAVRGVVAGVIARPPESPYDTLIVSVGDDAHIASGSLVSAQGGVPVGKVESVTGAYARIRLYSSSGMSVTGWAGSERTPVTLTGTGGGTFAALIPRAAKVAVGDMVYLPGPGGIPVGTVLRADGDPASPSLSLRIAPIVNPFTLTWVLISPAP